MVKKQIVKLPDCKDCRHMFNPHNRALDGQMILCRCPFHKWCRFMTGHGCDKFESKTRI